VVRLSTPRPWTAAGIRLSKPRLERHGAGTGIPVLLHHGFLINFNTLWYRSDVISRLAGDGRKTVLIAEHFLREASDAHAFGHDPTLLLAEMLSDAIDEVGQPEVDLVAAESGTVPAIVTAANDDRVRRLVLAEPEGAWFNGPLVLDVPDMPTLAELDLRVPCVHHGMAALLPAPGVRLLPEAVSAQTLIIASTRHRLDAEVLVTRMPKAEATFLEDDDAPATSDPRFAGYVGDFLL